MGEKSDPYRKQHEALLASVAEIRPLLASSAKARENAGTLRSWLSRFGGILRVHLAMEDKAIYPELLKHPREDVRRLAERFVQEMGGLKPDLERYLERWGTEAAIRADADDFVRDTARLVEVLERRIAAEDGELYVLYDST